MASHKLSIDTTFDPCLFSLHSPFKHFTKALFKAS
jgi:hypothetical protein